MNPFDSLAVAICDVFPELTPADLEFAPAPKLDVGDVALRTFLAAKKTRQAPPKIAQRIAETVRFGPTVREAVPAGPYLNFRLDRAHFARAIVATVLEQGDRYGSTGAGAGHKTLIEHTSINPNASPHVGRARNAMIGDSLVRLFRFDGYDVDVQYYVNDMGRQIGLLVLVCEDLSKLSFDDILAKYVEANDRAEADPEFAARGYELLARMEEGDPEVERQFHEVTDHCLRGQLAVLARLGIQYDEFVRESSFVKDPRLDAIVARLQESGAVFTDDEQRLVVDLSKLGYEREEGRYFVLKRANGSSLYGFRDLAYTIDKMSRGADVNLWVLGEDHKLYAEQQAMILRAAGYETPEPIYYAYILLKEGKMSTRQGKVVLLSDFLDEATTRAAERVRQQYPDLAADEQEAIAAKVAVAAVRFAILRVSPTKNVIFDLEEALSFTGDTGPYIQYSCARISSILRKYGEAPGSVAAEFPIETDPEWKLVTHLAGFSGTVATAREQRNCAPVAQYVLETARLFTTFYHECPVLTAETEALRRARAQLCAATRQTLSNGLALLGMDALDRM